MPITGYVMAVFWRLKMIIAIASDNEQVSDHFGHCKEFIFYNVEDNKVVSKQYIANPGHRPGYLPMFVNGNGANVIIAGGMGATAKELFIENGIQVVIGAQGHCDDIVNDYLNNTLALVDIEAIQTGHQCFSRSR